MEESNRWNFILDLDDELLKGGVILSEWCSLLVRETDITFAAGGYIATVVTAMAGIETYLRAEFGYGGKESLSSLIQQSPLPETLKVDLNNLRKYRNKLVHVPAPWDDQSLLDHPETYDRELEEMAKVAVRVLRQTIYENQWI